MTALLSAIGRGQLGEQRGWLTQRKGNASVLAERLAAGWDRDSAVAAIQNEGVPCMQGICPEIYREAAFAGTDFAPSERLPVARELGETSLMFPVHPTLGRADMEWMAGGVARVMERAAG